MARTAFAPSHSLLSRSRFIPQGDSAWDRERIKSEMEAMRKGWDGESADPCSPDDNGEGGHPFVRYQGGFTRFDLDAEGIREYLNMDAKPEMWELRRVTREDRVKVARSDDPNRAAYLLACVGLEGGDEQLAKLLRAEPRDEAAIVQRTEQVANSIFDEVGGAAMNASADLMPQEKKASAAGPGGSGG